MNRIKWYRYKQWYVDSILVEFWTIQGIVEACEGCDYIEI